MRSGRVLYLVGHILVILGLTMLLPLLCALIYQEQDAWVFALSAPVTILLGGALVWLCRRHRREALHQRESYLFVTTVWVMAGVCGGLPYQFYGCFPDFISCFFESVSGFTTTGSSALTDIEVLPHGILLWRSMTHWLGGAGIVLLFVALIQKDSSGEGLSIYRAEYSGGAFSERLAVRIEDNAKIIFAVYMGLSVACALLLMAGGMNLFDAVNHTMATVSTGGFSTRNASVAAYASPYIEWVIGIFLALSGMNFSLFFLLLVRGRVRDVLRDEELRAYLAAVVFFTALITGNLLHHRYFDGDFATSLRQAFFQVSSIISTGGFVTSDYDLWPNLSRGVLFMLLLVGGCSGSTASGVKFCRWVISCKGAGVSLSMLFRPDLVRSVKYNGRRLPPDLLTRVLVFLLLYFGLTSIGSLLLTCTGMPWVESISVAASSIGNVGPGLGATGPVGNFAGLNGFAKLVCSFLMLAGRLEIYTMLALLAPGIWKK